MNVLACDLGGTRMKIGVVRAGVVRAQTTLPANAKAGLAAGLPALQAAWVRLLNELNLERKECAGISLAFPSLVEVASGRVLAAFGKYPDAMNLDLRAWARTEFGLPLAIENDARMALIGEWRHGAGRGFENVVMLTLGTGLGTAAIIEGRVLRGRHGQAGVLGGHTTVRHDGRVCSCGNIGCAEAEASTASLCAVAESLPEWDASSLRKLTTLNYASVFRHAAAGDAAALRLREHSLRVWSALVVNLIHCYDPEVVVLGGGIMASGDVILPYLQNYVDQHACTPWGKVRVVASGLGDTAALVAAEWLLQEQFPELKR